MTAGAPTTKRFSISHLASLIPWIALVIGAWGAVGDSSFLWHIRAGTLQVEAGRVITTDPFSFTRGGADWLTQSWLAEVAYAWGEAISGLGFVPVYVLLASVVTFAGVASMAYRRSGSMPATAAILILTTLLVISFVVPRPVIFSYPLFVLVILAWERPQARWALPLLFWAWASVHGSFVVGLAFVGLSYLKNREWKSTPVVFVAGLATLATAHGLGVLQMLFDFSAATEVLHAYFPEWRSPSLGDTLFVPFAGGMAILAIGAYRQRVQPRDLYILVPFILLGLSSIRAVPPAWIGLVPLVATSMTGFSIGSKPRLGSKPGLVYGLIVLLLPFALIRPVEVSGSFPIEALAQLDDVPTFHDDRVGGFIIWAEGPDRKVFIDDRGELYGPRIEEFVEIRRGDGDWRAVFERDQISQALLGVDEPMVEALRTAGWVESHRDDLFVVLVPSG